MTEIPLPQAVSGGDVQDNSRSYEVEGGYRKLTTSTVLTSNLGTALATAVTGDTINLSTGTTFSGSTLAVTIAVTIQCVDLVNMCTLDGGSVRNVMNMYNVAGTIALSGLIITRGSVSGLGGGLCALTSTLTITSSSFTLNSAPNNVGGGIYAYSSTLL